MTLDEARDALTFCDSYSRLPTVLQLYAEGDGLNDRDALTLLGEIWESCDNVSRCFHDLNALIPDGNAPEMMNDEERAALAALPARVRIFRGADRGVNERGLCWTLDRATAERFPFLNRYKAATPVLVTATLSRRRIAAVMLGRDEHEVIVRPTWPRVLSVRPIKRATVRA